MNLFHEGNPIIIFLGYVFDIMLLNLLTLFCCIPIITAGASMTAMHYALVHGIEEKQGGIVRLFFDAFRKNFMQATLIWMPILGVLSVVAAFLIRWSGAGGMGEAELIAGVAAALIVLLLAMVFLYAFPLLARYQNTFYKTVLNALRVAMAHIPQTGAMMAIYIVYAFFFRRYWQQMMVFVCLFGLSVPGWLCMKLYLPVFWHLEAGQEEDNSDS